MAPRKTKAAESHETMPAAKKSRPNKIDQRANGGDPGSRGPVRDEETEDLFESNIQRNFVNLTTLERPFCRIMPADSGRNDFPRSKDGSVYILIDQECLLYQYHLSKYTLARLSTFFNYALFGRPTNQHETWNKNSGPPQALFDLDYSIADCGWGLRRASFYEPKSSSEGRSRSASKNMVNGTTASNVFEQNTFPPVVNVLGLSGTHVVPQPARNTMTRNLHVSNNENLYVTRNGDANCVINASSRIELGFKCHGGDGSGVVEIIHVINAKKVEPIADYVPHELQTPRPESTDHSSLSKDSDTKIENQISGPAPLPAYEFSEKIERSAVIMKQTKQEDESKRGAEAKIGQQPKYEVDPKHEENLKYEEGLKCEENSDYEQKPKYEEGRKHEEQRKFEEEIMHKEGPKCEEERKHEEEPKPGGELNYEEEATGEIKASPNGEPKETGAAGKTLEPTAAANINIGKTVTATVTSNGKGNSLPRTEPRNKKQRLEDASLSLQVAIPTRPPIELSEAYDNVFRVFHNIAPNISVISISVALKQCQNMIAVAKSLGALSVIRPSLGNALSQFGKQLFLDIVDEPYRWLKLSIAIESSLIFKESVIHIVGKRARYVDKKTDNLLDFPLPVRTLVNFKSLELYQKKGEVNETLLVSTIMEGPLNIGSLHAGSLKLRTWYVVQIWRDWLSRQIAFCQEDGLRSTELYRVIARAGDAYLEPETVGTMIAERLGYSQSSEEFDFEEVKEDLELMKVYAQRVVQILFVNNSVLHATDTGINYLTCTEVTNEDLPWYKGFET